MPRKKCEEDSPHGFKCPECGITLAVIRTKRVGKGIVRRVRECPVCGHLQRTVERTDGHLPASKSGH